MVLIFCSVFMVSTYSAVCSAIISTSELTTIPWTRALFLVSFSLLYLHSLLTRTSKPMLMMEKQIRGDWSDRPKTLTFGKSNPRSFPHCAFANINQLLPSSFPLPLLPSLHSLGAVSCGLCNFLPESSAFLKYRHLTMPQRRRRLPISPFAQGYTPQMREALVNQISLLGSTMVANKLIAWTECRFQTSQYFHPS